MIPERVLIDYKRRRIESLIREIDFLYAGNDEIFLNSYIAELLNKCENDLSIISAVNTALEDIKAVKLRIDR